MRTARLTWFLTLAILALFSAGLIAARIAAGNRTEIDTYILFGIIAFAAYNIACTIRTIQTPEPASTSRKDMN